MFETNLTVIGNVVDEPVRRETSSGRELVSFRVASTARYWSADEGSWRDGGSVFLSVSCWRRMVMGVNASVHKGDPVIVHGAIRTARYTTKDGVERTNCEMHANAVGLDVARCIAERRDRGRGPSQGRPGQAREDGGATGEAAADGATDGEAAAPGLQEAEPDGESELVDA